jgi:hypothetical protein
MLLYRISGMIVLSEFELPGAWPIDAGEPDVVMRTGLVPETLAGPRTAMPNWEASDHAFLLRVAGVGRFLLLHGREVIFEPEDGKQQAACASYLQGTVVGMLLNQRGGIVMHASAVAVDGKAVLICGVSGAGKSTLAATLSTRGHGMVSDDVSLITFDAGGRPVVRSDARQLKLADPAIAALGLDADRGVAVPGNTEKSYVRPPSRWDGADLLLGGIYLLRSKTPGTDGITALDPAAALRRLQHNAYRPGLIRRMGQAARYFAANARIVQQAGVFMVDRERGLSRLMATAAMMEAHWQQIGLTGDRKIGEWRIRDAGSA